MYYYKWDKDTHGYLLTTQTGKFVANELRPVFAEELSIVGFDSRFVYDSDETRPLMWALKNQYFVDGEKVAQLNSTQYGKELSPEFYFDGQFELAPIDVSAMVEKNAEIMDILIADTKRRVKELYDKDASRCDVAYIAFSGGKDSVALLDICHRVLTLNAPVVFSNTDMELPDTLAMWDEIQKYYSDREFLSASAKTAALENWNTFGPPSRTIRWCCSVHKSAPALIMLKHKLQKSAIKAMAFVGVRREESYARSGYEDSGAGVKNASQINQMPLLEWGAHELWLYTFSKKLPINRAYRLGLSRVGCVMCPESSDKYQWYVDKLYPGLLNPYKDVILRTSSKAFRSDKERVDFIGSSSWQARRSGMTLLESISNPIEVQSGLSVTWKTTNLSRTLFNEWVKTLKVADYSFDGGDTITFTFKSLAEKIEMLPKIRAVLRKALSCVGCYSCEAECPTGAIRAVARSIQIDKTKCVSCLKCHDIDYGCWRFKSMRETEKPQKMLSGINSYFNFGLREVFVEKLVEMGASFFPWNEGQHPLGKKMVPSAAAWFHQAMLIDANKKPSDLVELFRTFGSASQLGWDCIWLALANNAPIVRWLVTATEYGIPYNITTMAEMFSSGFPELKASAVDCGLASLKDMLTKSPLGGDEAVISYITKGKSVVSIRRQAKDIDPLVALWGLYLIANKSDRGAFTVRELMTADFTSVFISPLVAFGLEPEAFKRQCQGLQSKYPEYISCTFTSGLDEITLFPDRHSTEEIIQLMLGE